jgi:hypothetical protein
LFRTRLFGPGIYHEVSAIRAAADFPDHSR